MSDKSTIEWTDATWNPVRGCTMISPGCVHCYAETFAERFRGVLGHPYEQGFDLRLVPEKLSEPAKWSSTKRVFVNSMSDLFHQNVPDDYIEMVCSVMQKVDWHIYQILTKRSERLRDLLLTKLNGPPKSGHIIWGVSVEDRKHGLPRIEHLRDSEARFKFLSIEPLIEDLGDFDLTGIDWVIVGGESGAGYRAMEEAWVISVLEQCIDAKIPFFFKQWGGFPKAKAGRLLQGRTWDEMPPLQCSAVPCSQDRRLIQSEIERRDHPKPSRC
jgi:protein gp37